VFSLIILLGTLTAQFSAAAEIRLVQIQDKNFGYPKGSPKSRSQAELPYPVFVVRDNEQGSLRYSVCYAHGFEITQILDAEKARLFDCVGVGPLYINHDLLKKFLTIYNEKLLPLTLADLQRWRATGNFGRTPEAYLYSIFIPYILNGSALRQFLLRRPSVRNKDEILVLDSSSRLDPTRFELTLYSFWSWQVRRPEETVLN